MKFIRAFKQFKESLKIDLTFNQIDLMESLSIWQDVLLSSISAENVNIINTLNLSSDFNKKLELEDLSENIEFINSLISIGLKKSPIQNTDDFETFLNKPCKFMFLFDFNSTELENPEYIIFQSWNKTLSKWEEFQLYKVKDDIKKFYDKLTSRTIEVIDNNKNYIYSTSNGNDWILQNIEQEDDRFKKNLTKEELQDLLDSEKISLNII
jgi:hypothetical protein